MGVGRQNGHFLSVDRYFLFQKHVQIPSPEEEMIELSSWTLEGAFIGKDVLEIG